MADVESAAAPPRTPPPPPRPATAASALRGAADAVVGAVILGLFASVWLKSAANAAYITAHWAYGEVSPEAVATKDLPFVASVHVGFLLHAFVVICLSMYWRHGIRRDIQAREVGGVGGAERPHLPEGAQGHDELSVPGAVVSLVVVLYFVMLVAELMGLRAMLQFVFLPNSLIFCFFTFPVVIIVLVVAASQTAESH